MSNARQQILTTAGDLFAQRGYELVGINEIIEKSGVAKATFYAQFGSKENLCAAWLQQEAAESGQQQRELLADPSSPVEKVARKFDAVKRYVEFSNFRGCPFSITASMLDSESEVRSIIADYKNAVRAFWQELASQIETDPQRSRSLGTSLFLLYSGAVTESQNVRDSWPVDSAKEAALCLCSSPKSD
jgi:AcrR family transcriptional regulator